MNSFKTALIVVVMLGVLYGVYRVLNMPEPRLTQDEQQMLQQAEDIQIELGVPNADGPTGSMTCSPATDSECLSPSPAAPDATANLDKDAATRLDVPPLTPRQPKSQYLADDADGGHTHDAARTKAGTPDRLDVADARTPRYELQSHEQPLRTAHETESDQVGLRAFERAWRNAEAFVNDGDFRRALEELTPFYDSPDLTPEEHDRLQSWLDPLAGKVIYSTEDLLLDPYTVQRGDTLEQIANRYAVPPTLLYNINRSRINNPNILIPGTELKVVQGPFEAQIDLASNKLTLFVQHLYAGHFAINVGNDPAPFTGNFHVRRVESGHIYVTRQGQSIPADSPNNPYGRWWIDLGSEVSIHGSAVTGNADGLGCIGLSRGDIEDVASILSDGSPVRIQN